MSACGGQCALLRCQVPWLVVPPSSLTQHMQGKLGHAWVPDATPTRQPIGSKLSGVPSFCAAHRQVEITDGACLGWGSDTISRPQQTAGLLQQARQPCRAGRLHSRTGPRTCMLSKMCLMLEEPTRGSWARPPASTLAEQFEDCAQQVSAAEPWATLESGRDGQCGKGVSGQPEPDSAESAAARCSAHLWRGEISLTQRSCRAGLVHQMHVRAAR